MTLTDVKLNKEYNQSHPKFTGERIALRIALRSAANSKRLGSLGHISRWRVNNYGELESSFGRMVRA